MKQTVKTSSKARPRTYARHRTISRRGREMLFESDSQYFLKLVIYFLLGTFWIKFGQPFSIYGLMITAIPLGLLIGIIAVKFIEKHQADRKIWYAVLLVVTIVTYFNAAGIVI